MGNFTDLAAWLDAQYLYVRWIYDGDTGRIYNLKLRAYQSGTIGDSDSRPRSFHKWSNPPRSGTWKIPLSSIVSEKNGMPFDLYGGTSWIHVWWSAFNVTYGRADTLVREQEVGKGRFLNVGYRQDEASLVWLSYKVETTILYPRILIEQYNPAGGYRDWSFVSRETRFEGEAWPGLHEGHMAYFRLTDDSTGKVLDERFGYYKPYEADGSDEIDGEEEPKPYLKWVAATAVGGLVLIGIFALVKRR